MRAVLLILSARPILSMPPGVGGDAGGGCVIEVDCGEMVTVEDAGDDEADGRNRCLVGMLRQDVSTKRDAGN